jgi:hypothetical protein
MNFQAFRAFVLVFTVPVSGAMLASGCARQDEGERCDRRSGSGDCESGLECVPSTRLLEGKVDRCCPREGVHISDDRCIRSSGGGGEGGSAGTGGEEDAGDAAEPDSNGGMAGASGAGGVDASDDACIACNYTSECDPPLVCGPRGCCQPECRDNRDCAESEQCVAGSCEAEPSEASTD